MDDLRDLAEWYRNLPKPAKIFIGPVLGVMIFGGIIGGAAWALTQDLFDHLGNTVQIFDWEIVVVVVVVVMLTAYLLLSRRRAMIKLLRLHKTEHDVYTHVLRADEILFRLLPKLVEANSREQPVKNLLLELLRAGCTVFGGRVSRASLLKPSQNGYLKPWVMNMMPPESVRQMTFYIGNGNRKKRGVAGVAYVTKQLHLVHLTQDASTGQWKSDDPDYQPHNSGQAPGYLSFVAVPVISGEETLGVLCFDSMDAVIFDSPDIQGVLLSLAQRVATTLRIYDQLCKQQKSPATVTSAGTTPNHSRTNTNLSTKPKPRMARKDGKAIAK